LLRLGACEHRFQVESLERGFDRYHVRKCRRSGETLGEAEEVPLC